MSWIQREADTSSASKSIGKDEIKMSVHVSGCQYTLCDNVMVRSRGRGIRLPGSHYKIDRGYEATAEDIRRGLFYALRTLTVKEKSLCLSELLQ